MPMIGSTYYGSSTIKSNTGSNGSQNTVDSTAALGFQGTLISAGKSAADLKPIDVAELPEDRYQSYRDGEQLRLAANKRYLESQYTDRSWTDTVEASLEAFPLADTPATQPYATVVVGGKVVATIDNQGVVASDDELGQKLQGILQGDVDGANGPDLAQARAEQIAELLGGEVRKVDTAMTQSQFNASPSNETNSFGPLSTTRR